MKNLITTIVAALNGTIVVESPDPARHHISSVICSDLMSDVLVNECENPLLLTSLATVQAVHTAEVIGAHAVIIANGKRIDPAMTQTAERLGITLAGTPLAKFEASVAIAKVMCP